MAIPSSISNRTKGSAITGAKGIEKVILIINDGVVSIQGTLQNIFDGKPLPSGSKHKNPLDYGLIPITQDLAQIDLCNVINYTISKIPNIKRNTPQGANKTDGSSNDADGTKKDSKPKSQFQRSLQFVQEKAYDAQLLIDRYYSDYAEVDNPNSRVALFTLAQNVQTVLSSVDSLSVQPNEDMEKVFPQIKAYNNFISNASGFFNKYASFSSISIKELEKVNSYFQKIRAILIAIQSFDANDPAKLLQLGVNFLPPNVQENINRINRLVKPERLLPFIKNVQLACLNLQKIANFMVSLIKRAQSVIVTLTGIVRVVLFIKDKFLLPLLSLIPSMFSTEGVSLGFVKAEKKLTDLLENILKRLSQLNSVLAVIAYTVEYIISQIDLMLPNIKIIIQNLESCSEADPQIVKDLKNTVSQLEDTLQVLKDFRNTYQYKTTEKDKTYGDSKNKYTIRVIEEQLTDEGISIRRRYGVALDKYGVLVASSTPTFASDTSIIVEEVKLVLVSNKLVNPELSSLSSEGIITINTALNYLEDSEEFSEVNVELATDADGLDDPNNENEDVGIGLNAFVNKLNGGKKLRKRVRERLLKISNKFQQELATGNFDSPVTQKVAKQQSAYSKNIQIEELNAKKGELEKQRNDALKQGFSGREVVKQKQLEIDAINKQILELRK